MKILEMDLAKDLAMKAGCELIDMEMVQFFCLQEWLSQKKLKVHWSPNLLGEGGRLINNNGERFMNKYDPERMELSTRDKVAIANYKEIIEGRGTKNGGVFFDYLHKSTHWIIKKLR